MADSSLSPPPNLVRAHSVCSLYKLHNKTGSVFVHFVVEFVRSQQYTTTDAKHAARYVQTILHRFARRQQVRNNAVKI